MRYLLCLLSARWEIWWSRWPRARTEKSWLINRDLWINVLPFAVVWAVKTGSSLGLQKNMEVETWLTCTEPWHGHEVVFRWFAILISKVSLPDNRFTKNPCHSTRCICIFLDLSRRALSCEQRYLKRGEIGRGSGKKHWYKIVNVELPRRDVDPGEQRIIASSTIICDAWRASISPTPNCKFLICNWPYWLLRRH